MGGYGTTQELLTLQHEVWKYSPDLVLLAVTTGNDISDNSRRLKRNDETYHVFPGDRLVLDTSFRAVRGLSQPGALDPAPARPDSALASRSIGQPGAPRQSKNRAAAGESYPRRRGGHARRGPPPAGDL